MTAQTTTDATDVHALILEAMGHCRDTSLRDGIQSWDANKWRIGHILPVAASLNALAENVRMQAEQASSDTRMAPVEAWGGGQVKQPADFLGEDPFHNLKQLHAAMPELKIQALYRGPQGYGFEPVSAEVQEAMLRASVDNGVEVVRVFDMMNDPKNLKTAFDIAKKMKAEGKRFEMEGALSYINEPARADDFAHRAMTFEEYGALAVTMARDGADSIAIKNYAGGGDAEMAPLVATIRESLQAAGFDRLPVNLHTHGEKPEVLLDAIESGATLVDVGIGKLAAGSELNAKGEKLTGPAHTDILAFLDGYLARRGVDVEAARGEIEADPIVQGIRATERVIAEQLQAQPGMEAKRPRSLTQERVDRYHMAAGALSDLWNTRIQPMIRENKLQLGKVTLKGDAEIGQFYDYVLTRANSLWDMAGRPNTVTPGAKIISEQALALSMKEVLAARPADFPQPAGTKNANGDRHARIGRSYVPGEEKEEQAWLPEQKPLDRFELGEFGREYLDIVKGRYGLNRGLEIEGKAIGDRAFRDAALMQEALVGLNEHYKSGENPTPFRFIVEPWKETLKVGGTPKSGYGLDIKQAGLTAALKDIPIEEFRSRAEKAPGLPKDLRESLLKILSPGRIHEPRQTVKMGQRQLMEAGKLIPGLRDEDGKFPDRLNADTAPLLPTVVGVKGAANVYAHSVGYELNGQMDQLVKAMNEAGKNTGLKIA